MPTVPILLEAPITFETEAGLAHAPMVVGIIGDRSTRLILDTGATDHILTTDLAARLGLDMSPGVAGSDSTGSSVPSWDVGEVELTIGGASLWLDAVIAIPGPALFASMGIGGFLSPQRLVGGGWAIVDLVSARLFLMSGEEAAVMAWIRQQWSTMRTLKLVRKPSDGRIIVGAVAVNGLPPTEALLDTGGKATEAAPSAVDGMVGGRRHSTGQGVSGVEAFGATIEGQALALGTEVLPLDRLVLRDGDADGYGILIGMDTLRGTVLAVSGNAADAVFWTVPNRASAG